MPTFNFYSAWMDPVFYAWAAAAAAALVGLIYAIRRYLELKNASSFEEEEIPAAEAAALQDLPEVPAEQPELPVEEVASAPAPAAAAEPQPSAAPNPAETFVRGIYEGISNLDSRLKVIESYLSKSRVNSDFTVKFLEDILQDMETLDKPKLKARIEYLLSDLKK